jgi:hypothetical protein
VIPWATLLKHSPALISAADALLARVKANKSDRAPQGVEERLTAFEQELRDSAQLLKDLTQQVNGLTEAHAVAAKRARTAVIVAVIAAAVAVSALVVAFR